MWNVDRQAARIAGTYAALAAAWIWLVENPILGLAVDEAVFSKSTLWTGLVLILASAALLYGTARRWQSAPSAESEPASPSGTGRRARWTLYGLAGALILSVGWNGIVHITTQARNNGIGELRAVADMKAAQIATWFDAHEATAQALRHDNDISELHQRWRSAADEASRAKLLHRLEAFRGAHEFLGVLLLDERGNVLLSTGNGAVTPQPEVRSAAQSALALGRVEHTDLYASATPSVARARLDWIVPLRSASGQPQATVVVQTDPRRVLAPVSEPWPVSRTSAQTLLLRTDGSLAYDGRTRNPGTERGKPFAQLRHETLAAKTMRDDIPVGQVVDSVGDNGQLMLSVVRKVAGTDWYLTARIDKTELYAAARQNAAWLALATVLAMGLVPACAVLWRQRARLRQLQRQRADEAGQAHQLHLMRTIIEGSPDAIFVKDTEGRYLLANPVMCHALGKSHEEVIHRTIDALVPAEEAREVQERDRQVMDSGEIVTHEHLVTTLDGPRVCLSTRGPLRDAQGRVMGLFGIVRDITERKQAEEKLRQAAMVFESTRDGVVITDADNRIQAVNRAFTEITGYSESDVIGQTPRILHSGRQGPSLYQEQWHTVLQGSTWAGEIWNRRKSGEIYSEWLTVNAVYDEKQRLTHRVGVFTDVTRMKRNEAEIERLAHYDPLTGLPNRTSAQLRLEHAIERARRRGTKVGLLYIDLDGFKTVNESLGHPVGDELLVIVAKRLKARLRGEDTLGRLGGDEFMVVIESLNEAEAAGVVARDLLSVVAAPMRLSGNRDAYITASIGISVFPEDATTPVELLRDADTALYRAKERGRNQFCFYTGNMNAEAVAKLEAEAALSQAIERKELLLHYQPKVDARTERLVGVEALIRWQRNGTMVPPMQFIPLAEKSGLIVDIGNWVIDNACRQVREWLDAGLEAPPVAVNVSARQFRSGDLDRVLADALSRYELSPDYLQVEVTESMLMDRPDEAVALLQRIKAIGVKLSLDDFGTGHSSLAYLQRFPIDELKIDRSFVKEIDSRPDGTTIVDTVIALAHRMHLKVVAEGVETPAQRDYLKEQGCDTMQGYHYSKPLPVIELHSTWLAKPDDAPAKKLA